QRLHARDPEQVRPAVKFLQGLWTVGILFLSSLATAQRPQLLNAKPIERSAKAGLAPLLRELSEANSPAWVAYSVPMIAGEHHLCCFGGSHGSIRISSCCGLCRLDGQRGVSISDKLENCQASLSNDFSVFLQVHRSQVQHVRTFSPACAIDAQGATVYWLSDVQPAQSVEYLSSLVTSQAQDGRAFPEEALAAIAMHAGPSADKSLEKFVQPG